MNFSLKKNALRKLQAHYTGWFISGLSELTKIAQGTNTAYLRFPFYVLQPLKDKLYVY